MVKLSFVPAAPATEASKSKIKTNWFHNGKLKDGSKKIKKETKPKKSNGFYNGKRQTNFSQDYMNNLIKKDIELGNKRYEEVKEFMKNKIDTEGQTDSFYVYDVKSVSERIKTWRHLMPRVEIFYATKCNSNDEIGKLCVKMNTGFDVASAAEIEQFIKLGAHPDNMIYANPIKQEDHILVAKKYGIKKMTFDSIEELHKIKRNFPEAECVIRVATEIVGGSAMYELSSKFGAFMEDMPEILKTAQKLGLKIKGASFHVGSGGVKYGEYEQCLVDVKKIFDMAEAMGLPKMDFLDLGGGFTYIQNGTGKNFNEVAQQIGDLVDKVFPDPTIRVIAEPGRYISESTLYIASQIFGKKIQPNGDRHYFINNGLYQSYFVRAWDEDYQLEPMDKKVLKRKQYKTTWWGQTFCDNDWVRKDVMEPEFEIGEWIVTKDHGPYCSDIQFEVGGFKLPSYNYFEAL